MQLYQKKTRNFNGKGAPWEIQQEALAHAMSASVPKFHTKT